MYKHSRTIFNELLDFLPWKKFEALIGQHGFDRYKKSFSWYNLLLVLMYAQITGKDSLRDIETSLSVHKNLHYHLWIQSIKRTTIAYNNKTCNHEIFENVFYELLKQVQWLYQKKKFNFYSLDSTTISTSLNLIPWAKHRTTKWAVKMHILLNNQNLVPDVIEITDGKKADVTIGKIMSLETKLEKWSFVIFDRWYVDYERYKKLNDNWLFFVTRAKRNMDYLVIKSKDIGINWVQKDDIVEVFNPNGKPYKWNLRLIHYISPDDGREYQFLTNNFEANPKIIALLYKNRREVELFFKFIKQNLKIKSFLWTSENAVRNQLRVAMIYYLIVCYIKFKTKVKQWLLELCRLFSESLLLKFKIIDILGLTPQYLKEISNFSRYWPVQESLF